MGADERTVENRRHADRPIWTATAQPVAISRDAQIGGFARYRPEAVTTLRDRLLNWCENFYKPVVGHTVARPATSGWNQPDLSDG